MKRVFVIVLLVLVTIFGFFLVSGTARLPLQLGVVGFTNVNGGSQSIQILITNDSAGHFLFATRVQSFSDLGLRHLTADTRYRSSGLVLSPRSITPQVIETFQNDGVIRLRITYRRVPSNFQNYLNMWLGKFGISPIYKPSELMEIVSEAITIPTP